MRNYKYEALCLSSALLWALAFPVMKFVGSGVDTVTFLALRFLIAAVVLCIAVRRKLKTITPKLLLAAGGVGLIFALHSFLQVEGLRYTSAANGGFITSLNVVFVPFFAYFFTKKKPTKNVVIGLIAAVLGFLLISGMVTVAPFGFHLTRLNKGDFLVFLCAVFTALYMITFNMVAQKYDETLVNFIHMAGAAIGLGIVWFFYPVKSMDFSAPFTIPGLLYCAVGASAMGHLFMAMAQAKLDSTKVAIICALECVFAAIFAAIITAFIPYPDGTRDVLNLTTIIGGGLVFFGVIEASVEKKEKQNVS